MTFKLSVSSALFGVLLAGTPSLVLIKSKAKRLGASRDGGASAAKRRDKRRA